MFIIKKFQHCTHDELSMILKWRNNPEIRNNMSDNKIIKPETHLGFVKKLKLSNDADHRLVEYNNEYLGVINLTDIHKDQAELGIYKNPETDTKGLGTLLMSCLFKMAEQHRVSLLHLKVLKNNDKAIGLYKKLEFKTFDEDEKYLKMEKKLNQKVLIVAELSANHNHKINIAKDSIKAVAETGADAVKIQTYTADTITIDCANEYFQIEKGTMWDGRTLYNLYKEAYTPWEWHDELRDYAESLGLVFFSTPFDFSAIDFLEERNNPIYKIASFEITDIPLIEYAASKKKPMIISTGIAEIQEIQEAVQACHKMKNYDVTLLKCTSSYPAPVEEANLKTMVNMKETFGVKVGLSDHTLGSVTALAAVALGAEVIEKHFILDQNIGGPDAAFSMEPEKFKAMVKSIRNVEKALGLVTYSLSEKAKKNREFSRSLFVVKDMKKGDVFTNVNIRSIRPGNGLSPKHINDIIGKKITADAGGGTPLTWTHIG